MKLQLSAIDTWFFRDGTPFDMDGASQSGVVGTFPPHPPTVAGALRAALARRNGWDGRGRWSGGELAAILGDGPEDLGRLRITGPFVLRGGEPVFPMPRHVVGRVDGGAGWAPVALLRPAREPVASDLGVDVRLPEIIPDASGGRGEALLEVGAGRWVTLSGLRRVLRGELPHADEIVHERALWIGEVRVGIARPVDSRTVADGALYSTRHARPARDVSLGVEVEGVPAGWRSPVGDQIPLGGEHRLAACEAWDPQVGLALEAPARGVPTAVIVALTPVLLAGPGVGLTLPGARIISACIERPLRIGGWDSGTGRSLPLKNAAPPGSVWFCEIDDASAFDTVITSGLMRAGAATAAGFGLCAVGGAPRWERTT